MIETIEKGLMLPFKLLAEVVGTAWHLLYIGLIEAASFLHKPSLRNALGIFVVGPAVGLYTFLTNRNSLIAGVGAGILSAAIAAFTLPTFPVLLPFGVAIAANLFTGIVESRIVRARNAHELCDAIDESKYGQFNYVVRKDIVEQKFPNGLGPLPKAVHFNFVAANKFAKQGSRPYRVHEVYWMPENMAGLEMPRKERPGR